MKVLALVFVIGACSAGAQSDKERDGLEYRGIYSSANTEELQMNMHTNHPDYDWGVWGHNLKKILGNNITDDMYATVNGAKDMSQLCFSSKELYDAVYHFIMDQYGKGTAGYSERISIMPMDNKVACMCPKCVEKGNTPGNATPAVTDFVKKLALGFPMHQFFTSAYHTTKIAPAQTMPDNVGVFISSISLQMRVNPAGKQGYNAFVTLVKAWKSKCKKVYIWDYDRNFDDYLSPFPCLLAMQSRLKLYKQLGVNGIFINGSGDDYSAFDDMQTSVLAQMMENPDIDVHKAVHDYYMKYYPVTCETLTDYYWSLEKRASDTNKVLPLYGNMNKMCESYLNPEEFVSFRSKLDRESKSTEAEERSRLNALLTALAYTQLEMYRCGLLPMDVEMAEEMREVLKGHVELKGMVKRDEMGHLIVDYLRKWEDL